jgi:hypothetical protein
MQRGGDMTPNLPPDVLAKTALLTQPLAMVTFRPTARARYSVVGLDVVSLGALVVVVVDLPIGFAL